MDVYSSMLTVLRSSEAVTAFGLRNLQQDTVGHVTASLQADQLLARMPSGSKLPQVNFGRGRTADVVRIDAEGEAHTKVFHIDLTYKQLPKGVVAYGSLLRAQKPVGAVAILLGEEESSFDISVDSSVDGAFGEPNFALSIDSS
ncbi:hypothetical protein [Actinocorallia sp. A-T 12471]|uniref:hypothetical protein n=1 Tax=Actinocorallia sp. A-T 12471 TaxID=3089813 RepID=UPI0029CF3817|nr:hypothetical protein [Actinocorallia sp. A-T 12471]MDX6744712.1 hypothetical protein [Actinocorallia sp. A-T 12471]